VAEIDNFGKRREGKPSAPSGSKQLTNNKQINLRARRFNFKMFVSCDKRHLHGAASRGVVAPQGWPNPSQRSDQMAQANHSLSQHTPLTIAQHMAMATMTRAMQLARGAVKEALKRQRVRLADVDAKDISSWALVYLEDHPELIAEAKPVVEGWFARGVFGKRAQKEFIKYSGIEQLQGDRSVANGQS
jgi:hypothetical protein